MKTEELLYLMLYCLVKVIAENCKDEYKPCENGFCYSKIHPKVSVNVKKKIFDVECEIGIRTTKLGFAICPVIPYIDLLNIKNCEFNFNSDRDMEQFLNYNAVPTNHINFIFEENYKIIFKSYFFRIPKLESVSISNLNSKQALKVTFENLTSLNTIEIRGIKAYNIDLTISGCEHLQKLVVSNCSPNPLKSLLLRNTSKLIYLDLSRDRIKDLHPDAFKGLDNLKELILSGNKITKIDKNQFDPLTSLSKLLLGGNIISKIDWKIPPKLKEIQLHNNNFNHLPASFLEYVDRNSGLVLSLAGNDWNCDCQAMEWYKRNSKKIADLNNVTCNFIPNGSVKVHIAQVTLQNLCLAPGEQSLIVLIVTLLFLSFVTIFAFYSRQVIMAILYDKMFMYFSCMEDSIQDKEYDLFFCSYNLDIAIIEKFIKTLEPTQRLCIPERDWSDEGRITANVASSLRNSRATLLFITRSSLQHVWFQVEFRGAYNQKLEDDIHKMILVIGEDIKGVPIKEDIREVMENERKLIWGERWFWEKLRYKLHQSVRTSSN